MTSWNEPGEHETTTPPAVVALAAGTVWWLIGQLPWILAVMHVSEYYGPLADDRHASVPLFADGLGLLVYGGLVGGVGAGLVGGLALGSRAAVRTATLAGMTTVMAAVLVESFVAGETSDADPTDGRIIAGLVLATVAASMAGWVLGRFALRGLLSLGLAIAVVAGPLGSWLWSLTMGWLSTLLQVAGQPSAIDEIVAPWMWVLPEALLVAAALATIGARGLSRLAIWPAAVLAAWLLGWLLAFLVSVGYELQRYDSLAAAVEESWDLLFDGLVPTVESVVAYGVAVVLALAVAMMLPYLTTHGDHTGSVRRPRRSDESVHPVAHQ